MSFPLEEDLWPPWKSRFPQFSRITSTGEYLPSGKVPPGMFLLLYPRDPAPWFPNLVSPNVFDQLTRTTIQTNMSRIVFPRNRYRRLHSMARTLTGICTWKVAHITRPLFMRISFSMLWRRRSSCVLSWLLVCNKLKTSLDVSVLCQYHTVEEHFIRYSFCLRQHHDGMKNISNNMCRQRSRRLCNCCFALPENLATRLCCWSEP